MNRVLLLSLTILVITSPLLHAAVPAAPRILGAWREVDGKGRILCFQKERCIVRHGSRTRFYLARYRKDRVEVWVRGEYMAWKYSMTGKTLRIEEGRNKGKYERLRKPPEDLEPKPLALGKKGRLPEKTVNEIRSELLSRAKKDQAVRKDRRRVAEMGKVDRDNTAWLRDRIGEIGWIDARRFGRRASNDAFLIVQHSVSFRQACMTPIDSESIFGCPQRETIRRTADGHTINIQVTWSP